MEREEALKIAKLAHKEIKEVVDYWMNGHNPPLVLEWDEVIQIDEFIFGPEWFDGMD